MGWLEAEFVIPAHATGEGPGSRRLFSFYNMVELAVAKALVDQGLRPGPVQKLMQAVRDHGWLFKMYSSWAFAHGQDGLRFLIWPKLPVGASKEEMTRLLDAPRPEVRIGSLVWSEGWGVVSTATPSHEKFDVVGRAKALVVNIIPGPLAEHKDRVALFSRLLEGSEIMCVVNLGDLHCRVFEATVE